MNRIGSNVNTAGFSDLFDEFSNVLTIDLFNVIDSSFQITAASLCYSYIEKKKNWTVLSRMRVTTIGIFIT